MDPVLLDTDILSEVIKRRNPAAQQKALAYAQPHGPLVFSAVTRYEIVRGYRGQGATAQLSRAYLSQAIDNMHDGAVLAFFRGTPTGGKGRASPGELPDSARYHG